MEIKGQGLCMKIPRPREKSCELLKAANVRIPTVLPHQEVNVVTRKKLINNAELFKKRAFCIIYPS